MRVIVPSGLTVMLPEGMKFSPARGSGNTLIPERWENSSGETIGLFIVGV